MCYQVVERYSVCNCLYYRHSIDPCRAYGQQGHRVQEKVVLVGYACTDHSLPLEQQSIGRSVGRHDVDEAVEGGRGQAGRGGIAIRLPDSGYSSHASAQPDEYRAYRWSSRR